MVVGESFKELHMKKFVFAVAALAAVVGVGVVATQVMAAPPGVCSGCIPM